MNKEIKCPDTFKYSRPDVVAECYDVSEETYLHIWNVIVPKLEEDNCPSSFKFMPEPDAWAEWALPRYWGTFTEAMKHDIVKAAEKADKENQAIWEKVRKEQA
tara:strand:- start:116 stop:424 length:309 start_codon:yes stop_codon:yes gene_type:complete